MKRNYYAVLLATVLMTGVTACGAKETASNVAGTEPEAEQDMETVPGETGTDLNVTDISIYVQGYEWGPGVPRLILELDREVSDVSASDWTVTTAEQERTVTGVYLGDERGESVEGSSRYVVLELETTSEVSGKPFAYNMETALNDWMESYEVTVESSDLTADGTAFTVLASQDCIANRICPDTERFAYRDTSTGTYLNAFTNEMEEVSLNLAAYEPEALAGGEQNPLVIWLHGAGEGGKDADIAILGNEVCALAREEIQSHFTTENETGAYVLVVQCQTFWMDEGNGIDSTGSGVSRYTEALMDAIKKYVDGNPDVDPDRIYMGGCSNGGYMTLNMLLHDPDYFAAAYPCCEAYAHYEYEKNEDGTYQTVENKETGAAEYVRTDRRWMTDEKINTLKDIPIWFVVSADDTIVLPSDFVLPTYRELLKAGAENSWLSVFETVEGSDSPGRNYIGHGSWVYLFNDQVTGVQDKESIKASMDETTFGTAPSNEGGGVMDADGSSNLYEWLNAQHK